MRAVGTRAPVPPAVHVGTGEHPLPFGGERMVEIPVVVQVLVLPADLAGVHVEGGRRVVGPREPFTLHVVSIPR